MSPAIPEEKEQRLQDKTVENLVSEIGAWNDLIQEMTRQLTRKDLSHILADVCRKPAL